MTWWYWTFVKIHQYIYALQSNLFKPHRLNFHLNWTKSVFDKEKHFQFFPDPLYKTLYAHHLALIYNILKENKGQGRIYTPGILRKGRSASSEIVFYFSHSLNMTFHSMSVWKQHNIHYKDDIKVLNFDINNCSIPYQMEQTAILFTNIVIKGMHIKSLMY